jgi:endoglucanase
VATAAALALLGAGTTLLGAAPASAADQVENGTFDTGLDGWTIYPTGSHVDGAGCNTVPGGSGAYSAAIQQELPLVKGEEYRLSFKAKATPGIQGPVRVVIQGGPDINYEQFLPAQKPVFGEAFATHEYFFTASRDYPKAQLAFQQDIVNAEAYTLCVDDVSLQGGFEPPKYVPDTGPRVRVNQEAYLPRGPKGGTVVTESTTALPWELRLGKTVVKTGTTTPRGVDPSAGLNVHSLDFSDVTRRGSGYTLTVDGETSHPFDIDEGAYERLRRQSKTYFYTQRSGIEILDELAPGYGRAAGHVGVAPNQGDTAVPCQSLEDDSQKVLEKQGDRPWTCDYVSDVTGGWYDAGDHGKYVVNGGIAAAQLMQEYERSLRAPSADRRALGDSSLSIPEQGNRVPDLLDEVRWELEWFLKMQVKPGRPLAGMVFHKVADADWTGIPMDPAADPQARVLYRPSTAATLNVAATAAQGARLFERYDKAFSRRLLQAAQTAYTAAEANDVLYAPAPDGALDPNPGSGPYNDRSTSDERYWAATELFLTTGQNAYRKDLLASPHHDADVFTAGGFDWGNVAPLAKLQLATVSSRLNSAEVRAVREQVVAAADRYLADQAAQPFGQAYAPQGGKYVWGSNSQILNNMVVIATAYDLTGEARYRDGVVRSMDYILGRNALNLSYVTGYGDVFAKNQHSRQYANQADPSLPNPPAGTMSGGPNSTAANTGDPIATPLFKDGCAAQFCYIDDIGSWSTNEITINWNAPLSWVSSFIADLDRGDDAGARR